MGDHRRGHIQSVGITVVRIGLGVSVQLHQLRVNEMRDIPCQHISVGTGHIRKAVKAFHQFPQRASGSGCPLRAGHAAGQLCDNARAHIMQLITSVNSVNTWQCALNKGFC